MAPFSFNFLILLIMGDPVSYIPELITGGSGVIGSLINAWSQNKSNKAYLQGIKDTNATNLLIQRETNAQNLDMFNKANAFSERMWNKDAQYNSAAAQRARLIAAGVSPSEMSAGSASAVQSVAGSPAQAARMQAPDQTPVPDYGSAVHSIGGTVKDYYERQLLDEQIKQSRLATSMKQMDQAFYYDQKIRQAQKEASELISNGIKNDSDRMRLDDLQNEINHTRVMRDKTQRAADDEHDLATRRGLQIDAETSQILDNIRHMQESDRVSWFNARSNAVLNQATINKLSKESNLLELENEFKSLTWNDERQLSNIRVKAQKLDQEQKLILLYMLISNAQINERMKNSWFRQGINYALGIDVQQLFQGTGLFQMMK